MKATNGALVIVVGLILLWLAVTGRMASVWSAAMGAAAGDEPGPGVGGGAPEGIRVPSVPVISGGVSLPDLSPHVPTGLDLDPRSWYRAPNWLRWSWPTTNDPPDPTPADPMGPP